MSAGPSMMSSDVKQVSVRIVLALAIGLCLVLMITSRAESQDALARARASFEAGDFAAALGAVEEARRSAPSDAGVLLLKGRIHQSLGQWDEAVASFLEASQQSGARGEALRHLAPLWMRLGADADALRAYDELARLFPEDAGVAIPLGILQARKGLYGDAIDTLGRALSREDTAADAHHYLGTVYSAMGDWPNAIEHLDRSLELQKDPTKHGLSLYEKASVLSQQEKFAEALELLRLAQERMPDSGMVRFRMGEIHLYEGEVEAAETELKEALRLDPRLDAARTQLGVALFQGRKMEEATRVLEQAVRRMPQDARAHHYLARAYGALDEPDVASARQHFERALALDPRLTEAYLNYGNFLRRHGDPERGAELLTRFRELSEADKELAGLERLAAFSAGDEASKRELLRRLVEDGDFESALGRAQRFLVEDPEELQNHINLAVVYLRMGSFDDARDVLEEAPEAHAENAAVHGLLGDAYLGLRRREDALHAYQRAAELETGAADWSLKLAMTELGRSNREGAARALEQAIQKAPNDARAYNGLGVIELDAGRVERAIELLERAVELAPELAAAHRNLGEAYLKVGRAADGESALARAEALERDREP